MSGKLETRAHYSEVLEHTADSIEAYSVSLFSCATYQLVENALGDDTPAERIGSLMLYEVSCDDTPNDAVVSVRKLQHISTNAVLDMKWYKQYGGTTTTSNATAGNNAILTVADSKGEAHFYNLVNERLAHQNRLVIDAKSLALSTDWSKTAEPHQIAYSMSSGDLCIVQLTESEPTIVHNWKGHSLEAWIIACDYENGNLLYSGADDCRLKVWDQRMGFDNACFTSKYHEMGVCSIQANPVRKHVFASGSYDESVVLWDNRSMKTPLCEFKTGGGVWRLKWHPHHSNVILAACMRNGYKVIEYNSDLSVAECLCSYETHKSLAYGADWCLNAGLSGSAWEVNGTGSAVDRLKGSKIASCSFYDKLLTVWSLN